MRLTRYEMETIITFNEEEDTASVYTHNKALRRKLEKLAQDRPEECRWGRTSREGQAVNCVIPKTWVRITPTRIVSAAQREALANARERLKNSVGAEN